VTAPLAPYIDPVTKWVYEMLMVPYQIPGV